MTTSKCVLHQSVNYSGETVVLGLKLAAAPNLCRKQPTWIKLLWPTAILKQIKLDKFSLHAHRR